MTMSLYQGAELIQDEPTPRRMCSVFVNTEYKLFYGRLAGEFQESLFEFLSKSEPALEYRGVLDYFVCEALAELQPACRQFYSEKGPRLVFLGISAAEIRIIDRYLCYLLTKLRKRKSVKTWNQLHRSYRLGRPKRLDTGSWVVRDKIELEFVDELLEHVGPRITKKAIDNGIYELCG